VRVNVNMIHGCYISAEVIGLSGSDSALHYRLAFTIVNVYIIFFLFKQTIMNMCMCTGEAK